jgi:hypothetical protein
MDKRNIADLVYLKCKEWNCHNKCLMCQCCWLLCLFRGEYKTEKACEDLKLGALPGYFIQRRDQLRQQRI